MFANLRKNLAISLGKPHFVGLQESALALRAERNSLQTRLSELSYELRLARDSNAQLTAVAATAQETTVTEAMKVANWDYLVKCHEDGEALGLCVFHAGLGGELFPVSSEPDSLASLVYAKRLADVTAVPVS